MQLHQLKPTRNKKAKKRIGRGGKRGSYSGKGMKGQGARAGRKFQPIIREIIKRYPKKRGYRFNSWQEKPVAVNLNVLEKSFEEKAKVSPAILAEKSIIRKQSNKLPMVKILGRGQITKAFVIEDCEISKSAKEKIEKAGGVINDKIQMTNDK